jgi:DNA-binding response OmpR family regulator
LTEIPFYIEPTMDRILFVDDDAELRQIVHDELSDAGYLVDEAEDGVVAIEMLQKQDYALVLLDIVTPRKTGLEVLQFIKEQGMKCRIIMLTGMSGMSYAIESLKLGADDYITKPYNSEYLLSSIERVLAK